MSRLLHPLVFALFTAAPAARSEAPALRIDAPRPETATRLPLIEVAGGAGRSAGLGWDVVIVLDLSESTLHGSGLDLDGDDPGGGSDAALLGTLAAPGAALPGLAQRLREIDFDDTTAAWAALQVARRPESAGKLIVVILASTGERYISTELFKP